MSDTSVTVEKANQQIAGSNYISRDLSWLQFNYRVLDQSRAQ
jgi:polyphosphate kinase